MQVKVRVVNAFVEGERGGNPAGVVLQADALSTAQKQAIAAQVGLSETAFVSASQNAAFKLEFFTPARQIAHCGHATVATFSLLRQLGQVGEGWSSKETVDGNRAILLRGDMAFMEQTQPYYRELCSDVQVFEQVLAALGVGREQLLDSVWPTLVNTGVSFILVALQDEASVAAVVPDQAELLRLSEQFDLIGFYVFSPQPQVAGRDVGARMFAPRYGISEEAGTGMAAGPLACFLHDYMGVAGPRLLIEQGYLMQPPSPSLITVDLQLADGRIEGVLAGGRAQVMSELTVEI